MTNLAALFRNHSGKDERVPRMRDDSFIGEVTEPLLRDLNNFGCAVEDA